MSQCIGKIPVWCCQQDSASLDVHRYNSNWLQDAQNASLQARKSQDLNHTNSFTMSIGFNNSLNDTPTAL